MTTQISVETLYPITHHSIPVITTELLALLYGTEPVRIRQGHQRNIDRFICNKHYFKVEGKELADLRVSLSYSQRLQPSLRGLQISPKTRSLILWTERGAARHAKMLETDQAWEVFEKLEDNYFNQVSQHPATLKNFPADYKYYAEVKNGVTTHLQIARENESFISTESFRELMERAGWLMIHCDELKNMTIDEFMKLGATSQKTLELWKRK